VASDHFGVCFPITDFGGGGVGVNGGEGWKDAMHRIFYFDVKEPRKLRCFASNFEKKYHH